MMDRLSAALRLGRIEAYVLRQTLASLAVAFGVIAAVVMLMDFVEISRTVGDESRMSAIRLLTLMLLKSPAVIVELLPFVFLFGVLGAFVGLNRRGELVAIRAAGVSAWRFVLPTAAAAIGLGVLTVLVISPVASWMAESYRQQTDRLAILGGVDDQTGQPVWLREGDGQRQLVIRAESQDRRTGQLRDVSIFVYAISPEGERAFTERIDARTAALNAGRWRLTDARGAATGQQATAYATLDLPSSLDESQAFDQFVAPEAAPVWSLPPLIQRIGAAGFSTTDHRLRLQTLLAMPLLFAAMTILAAAFSLRLLRLGDLALVAVSGVGLGFLFFFINQFTTAMGSAEVLPPIVAAWLPSSLTALSALTLLIYTEDG